MVSFFIPQYFSIEDRVYLLHGKFQLSLSPHYVVAILSRFIKTQLVQLLNTALVNNFPIPVVCLKF